MRHRRDDGQEPDWEALGVHPSELLAEGDGGSSTGDELWIDGALRWEATPAEDLSWLSIVVTEPFDLGLWDRSARRWWRSVGDQLIGAAFQYAALDFNLTERRWGVVFEVGFSSDVLAEAFRRGEAMAAAMDQLGPLRLEVTSGRGGGGASVPARRPRRPLIGRGGAEIPLPEHRSQPAAPAPPPLVGWAGPRG